MTPATNNILDFLLGVNPAPVPGQQPGSTTAQAGEQTFVDLLGLLTQQQMVPTNQEQPEPFALVASNEPLPETKTTTVASPHEPTITANAPDISALLAGMLMVPPAHPTTDDLPVATKSPFESSLTEQADVPGKLTLSLPKTVAGQMQLVESMPLPAENRSFVVVAAAVQDGRLNLQLSSPDSPQDTIQVTLPAKMTGELLAAAELTGKNGRVSLSLNRSVPSQPGSPQNTPSLEQLLSQVKVTSLTIDAPAPEADASDSRQLSLRVRISSAPDSETVIKTALPAEQIHLTRRRTVRLTATKPSPQASFDGIADNLKTSPVAVTPKVAFAGTLNNTEKASVDLLSDKHGLELSMPQTTAHREPPTFGTHQMATDTFGNSGQPLPHQVSPRFSLPENAGRLLRQPGKSIMLRIQPDHLGPARLHLVMRHDVLTARVTVQTEQARGVVEHSLQQLHQQLDKAGIKVDQIDVNVAGENTQHDLPERQLAWGRDARPTLRTHTPEEQGPVTAPTAATTVSTGTGYINRNTINVLA